MKIYTKTGDKGTTSLVYGQRIAKNDLRVEAYGSCDEANSMIGLAVSYLKQEDRKEFQELQQLFHQVQTALFHVGAELSTPTDKEVKWKLKESDVKLLEEAIDRLDEELTPLQNFILPGGHPAGAAFHVARTVVRRVERIVVGLETNNPLVLSYLNRLSDLLFVVARYVHHILGEEEVNLHEGDKIDS